MVFFFNAYMKTCRYKLNRLLNLYFIIFKILLYASSWFFFQRIEEPFLVAVKETLGDRYSANMDNIYRKTVKFIIRELSQGFNDPPKAME